MESNQPSKQIAEVISNMPSEQITAVTQAAMGVPIITEGHKSAQQSDSTTSGTSDS